MNKVFDKLFKSSLDKIRRDAWLEGGLVGIRVGQEQERERILAIFKDLNIQPLSKQEFADKFGETVGK